MRPAKSLARDGEEKAAKLDLDLFQQTTVKHLNVQGGGGGESMHC